jgi:enoyl-CoA hydratase
MLLTGDAVAATDLFPGFLTRLIASDSPDDALLEAMELAEQWSALAPLTIAAHKLAIERSGGSQVSIEQVEAARLAAWNSEDAIEGRQAFRERRSPDFRNR